MHVAASGESDAPESDGIAKIATPSAEFPDGVPACAPARRQAAWMNARGKGVGENGVFPVKESSERVRERALRTERFSK